ncbi:MAG: transposase family protein [Nitrospira sp.]|nr:transposase family protein [Nitrospira sp.]
MFPQIHRPNEYAQSDFTAMGSLRITLNGQPFDHLFYHFVLPYSNWETGALCVSESFEALIAGFQAAVWELGRVPAIHRTDNLSAATHDLREGGRTFNERYRQVLDHYGVRPDANMPGRGQRMAMWNKPITGSSGRSSKRCCSGASATSTARRTMRSFCGRSSPGGIAGARRRFRTNFRTCTRCPPVASRISAYSGWW